MFGSLSRVARGAIAAGLLLTGLAVATDGGAASAQGANGRVRVMHASPDTPAVDIFVDGQKAVTALAFPDNTGYVSLPAGSRNVKVFVSPSDGTGAAALEADLNVAAGKDYTVLAVGQLADNSLALLPLEDNNAAPAAGNAHVRLIHASPDAPAVDVAVSGTSTKVFTNVPFKSTGAYTPVPAGTYSLDVQVSSSGAVALTVPGLALRDGGVYSAVAVGLAGNGTLKVLALQDAAPAGPSAPHTGTGLASTSGTNTMIILLGMLVVTAGAAGLAVARKRA